MYHVSASCLEVRDEHKKIKTGILFDRLALGDSLQMPGKIEDNHSFDSISCNGGENGRWEERNAKLITGEQRGWGAVMKCIVPPGFTVGHGYPNGNIVGISTGAIRNFEQLRRAQ